MHTISRWNWTLDLGSPHPDTSRCHNSAPRFHSIVHGGKGFFSTVFHCGESDEVLLDFRLIEYHLYE